jgi:bacterial/archaeal transporter family-2 protein
MVWIAVYVVFIGGITVVCRYLNTRFASYNGLSMGTLANYVSGLTVSLLAWLVFGDSSVIKPLGAVSFQTTIMFFGGAFGVVMVTMFIYVTPRLPAFLGTILMVVSQLGFGLVLDLFLSGTFSLGKTLGALMVLLGLGHYAWVNARKNSGTPKPSSLPV